jgi:hypothetical protein
MKIRSIVAATGVAMAFSMAGAVYACDGEAVTKKAAIPNIPGKSLVGVEVVYAPDAAFPPTPTRSRLSFTPV